MACEGNGKGSRNVEGKILRVLDRSCFRATRFISRRVGNSML